MPLPLLAVSLLREPLALRADLDGLSAIDPVLLAGTNAACSAGQHGAVFLLLGDARADPADVPVVRAGDVVGTLVVPYALEADAGRAAGRMTGLDVIPGQEPTNR